MRIALGESLLPVEHALAARAAVAVQTELGEEAFKTAWAEGWAMTPEQALTMLRQPSISIRRRQAALSSTNELTARKVEVLRLLAQGLTSAQMAEQLVISVVTVNFHVRSIYRKLGVSSRSAATRYAIERHLM